MSKQKKQKQPTAEKIEPDLTAEEIKFTRLVAKGIPATTAYRQAFPHKRSNTYNTTRTSASQLLTRSDIVTEVATTRVKQARLARLAEDKIEQALTEVKANKTSTDVAMFMYDHANGRSVQKIESQSAHVSVVYDLSGGGEPVPKHIQDQLKKLDEKK